MKIIPLTKNKKAIVDDDDYKKINEYKWYAKKEYYSDNYYAYKTIRINNKKTIKGMHEYIIKAPKGKLIDHKNHNTLDNRKDNLRIVNHSQNNFNMVKRKTYKGKITTSKYKGVSYDKERNKWKTVIQAYKKFYHIGRFKTEIEAALAYNKKALELFGEFAYLNEV